MITTVTLNPCIDYTVNVPELALGELNVMSSSRLDVSGKGVNVAVVLSRLGVPALCTGISFSANHAELAAFLDGEGVAHDFAMARGSIRMNIKINDGGESRRMTEINSRGDKVSPDMLKQAREKITRLAAKSDMLIMSGRIPNGASEDIYRQIMQDLRGCGCKIVIDAERRPLIEAVKGCPFLIKPNLHELEVSFGRPVRDISDILSVCGMIISSGVEVVCVSMSERGALIASREGAYHAVVSDIKPLGLQGAGDSMVAGICKAVSEGRNLSDMLKFGIAAASASIVREGTDLCRSKDFEDMLARVEIEKIG